MRKHSIEFKVKNPQRWSNPCQSIQQTAQDFYRQKPPIKRCESASTFTRKDKNQLSHLDQKFRILEQDYQRMLQTFRGKRNIFDRQKMEIRRLQQETMKEQKQIERLEQILKLIGKKEVGLQTQWEIDKSTWRMQNEFSNGQSDMTFETRCEEIPTVKKSNKTKKCRALDHQKGINRAKLSKICRHTTHANNGEEWEQDKKGDAMNNKYKFIPTLEFKHLG